MLGLGNSIVTSAFSQEGFELTSINGLQLWLKNKEGVTDNGTLTWADSSGNSNDATQSTVNSKPDYDSEDGSFDFAGSTGSNPIHLDLADDISLGAFTAFFAIDMVFPTPGTSDFYILTDVALGTNKLIQMFKSSQDTTSVFGYVLGGTAGAPSGTGARGFSTPPVANTKFVLVITKSAASGATIKFFKNSTEMVSTTLFSSSNTVDIEIIGSSQQGGRSHSGKIYEIAIYDSLLSSDNITSVLNNIGERNSIDVQ